MVTKAPYRILHLSDLHAGMRGQDLLWPNLKAAFVDDLSRLYDQVGSWDMVYAASTPHRFFSCSDLRLIYGPSYELTEEYLASSL